MQSEYPLSVLMVVLPWPGPVEQNPEPTTPTGPPRPAAAAAATLSRYHGYMTGILAKLHYFPRNITQFVRPVSVPETDSRSKHVAFLFLSPSLFFRFLLLFLSLLLSIGDVLYYYDAPRCTPPAIISLHCGQWRDIVAISHARAKAHTTRSAWSSKRENSEDDDHAPRTITGIRTGHGHDFRVSERSLARALTAYLVAVPRTEVACRAFLLAAGSVRSVVLGTRSSTSSLPRVAANSLARAARSTRCCCCSSERERARHRSADRPPVRSSRY